MEITAKMVKDLREATGAGPLDCKKALESTDGDVQKAIDFLREKGLAKAAKKLGAGRSMNEGVVQTYAHHTKRLGVLVEVNCETDFVANTDAFQEFARNVALQVANLAPKYLRREDVPEAEVQEEREALRRRALEEGRKENIIEKIIDGRMDKYFEEICLLEQKFIKDDEKTIAQMLSTAVAELGESIQISRFARFAIGESTADES